MQIRVYAGQKDPLNFEPSETMIGFTLSSDAVVADGISRIGSDGILAYTYPLVISILYMVLLHSFFSYYYPKNKEKVSQLLKNNDELVAGLTVTAVMVIVADTSIRISNSILWTAFTRGNSAGIFITIWLPQLFFFGFVISTNLFYHARFLTKHSIVQDEGNVTHSRCMRCEDTLRTFLSNISLHIILVICLLLFDITYAIFPAFLLLFAYPIQVVAVLAQVVAFLFAMTVFSAIMIKLYKKVVPKPRTKQRWKTIKFILLRFLPFVLGMLLLQYNIYILLYSLIIWRGPVISAEPLFILSVLPPALLSSVTWLAKRSLLDEKKRPLLDDTKMPLLATQSDDSNGSLPVHMNYKRSFSRTETTI